MCPVHCCTDSYPCMTAGNSNFYALHVCNLFLILPNDAGEGTVAFGGCWVCSRGSQLEPYVTTSLVQLLCRTTKLCWFDDDHFKTIVDDAKTLLAKGSSGMPVWPCEILSCLLCRDLHTTSAPELTFAGWTLRPAPTRPSPAYLSREHLVRQWICAP